MPYSDLKPSNMRRLGLLIALLLAFVTLKAQTAGMVVSLQQVHVTADAVSFDLYVHAQGKSKEYLGFCDFVLAFEKGRLGPNAELTYLDGSMQLQTAEQQLAMRYPLTYVMRVYQRETHDLVYIGIDPPRFREPTEFVTWVAEIDATEQLHRVGRFQIKGVLQAPDSLTFHKADKGLRTQCYNFRPAEQFAARSTKLEARPIGLENQWLEFFDLSRDGATVQLKWQPGEAFTWQTLSVERSYDGKVWEELAYTPASARSISDKPSPPTLLEGQPLVYYRLLVGAKGDKTFVSPIRLLQF